MSIKDMAKRKIKHNDLLPWFLEDHGQLPASYLKSTQKFFDGLRATSNKPQATSLTMEQGYYRMEKTNKGERT